MTSSNTTRLITRLRRVGVYEAISFLVLLGIAMPLKYVWGHPLPVRIMGTIHGVLFMWLCFVLLETKNAVGWNARQTLPYFIAAFLPFGPFVSDRKLRVVEERLGRGEMS